ncbi:FAD-binding oxidoreductase [Zoogloea dura]|jgi:FAD/FMN-containing dehydrogenase|uniref:FAD-binding oxidoreductase n=1 Tax=Zoogloea dura TaxID=2728840 RepID=A0A848GAV1_9RHOO|nr:FAD-binding oxidoreductase [Zoogloea dura]NML28659.1 FAD-binding oxidoreductase [Zoogloea dura]
MTDFIASLQALLGAPHCLVDAAGMAPWLSDWRGRYTGNALAVVRPQDTAQVAEVVRLCGAAGVAIVPQGGNTGLCGGATPLMEGRCIVLNVSRLRRLRDVDQANNTLTIEAGATLAEAQAAAAAVDRLFPLSLASEGSCEVGGVISTNAGGVQVLRYGNTRDLVLGLEVVLPSGEVWNGLRGLRKDNTGYDLKQLFIGAEGTLGIVTAATLKLFPRPRATATAWLAVPTPAKAVELLGRLREAAGERVSAFELVGRQALELVFQHIEAAGDPLSGVHPWYVLAELTDFGEQAALAALLEEVLADAGDDGCLLDGVVATSERQAAELWRLRENISEAQKREGFSIKHDISVPLSAIPEFLERAGQALEASYPGIRIVAFGHVGDGNLHYNQSQPARGANAAFLARTEEVGRVVHDVVHSLHGSISAEHGIGQLKRELLTRYKSPVEMAMMRGIKGLFDPAGIMNPGKVL